MPDISIIMPLYKAAKHLSEAIESIMAQTYTDWELLAICEPDSTDDTIKIVERYVKRDTRIKAIFNNSHLGIAKSLNIGICVANGEFIARMDGDDVSLPERLERQVAFLRNHTDISILGSNIRFIDDNGRLGKHISNYPLGHDHIKSDLLFFCNIMHPTVMMRKSDIEKYKLLYDESYIVSEDFELWSRACHLAKLANLPDVLLYYRWGFKSATRSNSKVVDSNHVKIIGRTCQLLGVAFSLEELQILHTRTCNMTFYNSRHIKNMLESVAKRITAANEERKVYQPEALNVTLGKRLYWKKYPVRWFVAIAIRSIAVLFKNNTNFMGLASYLEQQGIPMTIYRCILFLLHPFQRVVGDL